MSTNKLIQDLILFYVKENYNKYLEENELQIIPEKDIESVISQLYLGKKEHIQVFLKSSLQQLMKDEYIGDQTLSNICREIFSDDELCKNRLVMEIKNYQKTKSE
tara:strand:- start:436 stop:750 length:315 start_codon:yes stop_codon:yes gene_type:complete